RAGRVAGRSGAVGVRPWDIQRPGLGVAPHCRRRLTSPPAPLPLSPRLRGDHVAPCATLRNDTQYEPTVSISRYLAVPRAPGVRRVHGRAELPAAEGRRVTKLAGDGGPAGSHRIDRLPRLVERLQRPGPGPPHPGRVRG